MPGSSSSHRLLHPGLFTLWLCAHKYSSGMGSWHTLAGFHLHHIISSFSKLRWKLLVADKNPVALLISVIQDSCIAIFLWSPVSLMRNNTQLMKSAIRNKQQTPAALQMPSWPRGRNVSSNIPQQQMPFYFHVCFPRGRGCPVWHTVAVAPQGNQLLCQWQGTQLEEGAQSQQTHRWQPQPWGVRVGLSPSLRAPACTGAGCAAATLNGSWHSSAALHLNTDEDEFIPAFSIYFRAGKREISCYPRLSSGHKAVLDDRWSLAPAAHCGLCLWEMLYLFFFFLWDTFNPSTILTINSSFWDSQS